MAWPLFIYSNVGLLFGITACVFSLMAWQQLRTHQPQRGWALALLGGLGGVGVILFGAWLMLYLPSTTSLWQLFYIERETQRLSGPLAYVCPDYVSPSLGPEAEACAVSAFTAQKVFQAEVCQGADHYWACYRITHNLWGEVHFLFYTTDVNGSPSSMTVKPVLQCHNPHVATKHFKFSDQPGPVIECD